MYLKLIDHDIYNYDDIKNIENILADGYDSYFDDINLYLNLQTSNYNYKFNFKDIKILKQYFKTITNNRYLIYSFINNFHRINISSFNYSLNNYVLTTSNKLNILLKFINNLEQMQSYTNPNLEQDINNLHTVISLDRYKTFFKNYVRFSIDHKRITLDTPVGWFYCFVDDNENVKNIINYMTFKNKNFLEKMATDLKIKTLEEL